MIGILADVNKDAYQSDYVYLKKAVTAAEALGNLGDVRAVEPLLAALDATHRDVSNIGFHLAAVESLGRLANPRAIQPLINLLKYQDGVQIPKPSLGDAIAEALGKIGTPAVDPLITFLKENGAFSEKGKSLWLWKPKEPLKGSGPVYSKMYVVRALGLIGDARAVQPLIAMLKNFPESPGINSEARIALGKIGFPAVEPLIGCLKEKALRADAADALGRTGDERALRPLIALLKDKDKFVRKAAAWALGYLGLPAVEPLIACIHDPEDFIQEAVIKALENIGDERAIQPLTSLLISPYNYIQDAARRAIESIKRAGS